MATDATGLGLGIGQGGKPGKTLLVKPTSASDFDTLRNVYGYGVDPISGAVLIFSTLNEAVDACRAGLGDTILLAPGVAETLDSAGDITIDVAGISIIGLGNGNNRPVFTFSSSDNSATFVVSANNVRIENIVGVCNDDGLTNAFVVTGDNCYLDIEFQDTSSAVETATAVRLDTANNAYLKLKYNGFTGGNAVVSAVRLDDCDNVRIEIDAFGVVSTAWVEMVDVASTNVVVTGRMFTQGVTDFSRDVVDTITGSSWAADIFDLSAGAKVSGGSGAALASDDVSEVLNRISGSGIASYPSAAAPANGASLAAVLSKIYETEEKIATAGGAIGDFLVNGTTIFTVSSPIEIVSLVSLCITANDATASTLQWSADPTTGSATTFTGASASLANAAAGTSVVVQGTALSTAPVVNANGVGINAMKSTGIIIPAGIITTVVGVGSTTGRWFHYLKYKALIDGATVT